MSLQHREVSRILDPVGKPDVAVTRDLGGRIVLLGVDREGEEIGRPAQAIGGAVTLVDVAIDHEGPRDRPLRVQGAGGHRDIVEDAEAGARVAARVVAAAGRAAGDALRQGEASRQQGSAHGGAGTGHHRFAHRQADIALDRRRNIQRQDRLHVGAVVGNGEEIGAGGFGADEPVQHESPRHQDLGEPTILAHGEAVPLGQGRLIGRVEDDRQTHGRGFMMGVVIRDPPRGFRPGPTRCRRRPRCAGRGSHRRRTRGACRDRRGRARRRCSRQGRSASGGRGRAPG